MQFEYSHGLLGFFMKYFGGIMMVSFAGMCFLVVYAFLSKPCLSFTDVIGLLLMIFLIVSSLMAAFYFFRYSKWFTKKFMFLNNSIIVKDKDREAEYEIRSITYRSLWKLFEITTIDDEKIVLMNNAGSETDSFLQLKEFLFKKEYTVRKWF